MRSSMRREAEGLTFIELMVTIVIITVLAGWLLSASMSYLRLAEDMRDRGMLEMIETALEMYEAENQHYPYAAHYKTAQLQNAKMLYDELFDRHMQGKFPKRYLAVDSTDGRTYFVDQHGNPVIYVYYDDAPRGSPGQPAPGTWQGARPPYAGNHFRFELWSAGRDGEFDTLGTEGVDADNISFSIDDVVRGGI